MSNIQYLVSAEKEYEHLFMLKVAESKFLFIYTHSSYCYKESSTQIFGVFVFF